MFSFVVCNQETQNEILRKSNGDEIITVFKWGTMQLCSMFSCCFTNPTPGSVHLFTTKLKRNQSIEHWITLFMIYEVTICIVLSVINKKLQVMERVCVAAPQRQDLGHSEALVGFQPKDDW